MDKFQQLDNTIHNAAGKSLFSSKNTVEEIALNKIVPRYKNLYIRNDERLKTLIKSIRSEGLISPINVMKIKNAIRLKDKEKDAEEIEYLKNAQKDGKEYVVISGHRRFYSCCFIAIQDFKSDLFDENLSIKDQLNLLTDDLYEKASDESFKANSLMDIEAAKVAAKNEEKLYISCVVENKRISQIEEALKHLKENLARENTTTFEAVININNFIEEQGIKDQIVEEYGKDTKEYVVILQRYINDEYGLDVNDKTIMKFLGMYKEYSRKVIEYIFAGGISIRNITSIFSFYKKLNEQEREEADLLIINGKWEDVKNIRTIKRRKKAKVCKYNSNDIIDMLENVKSGKYTIDEVINFFKKGAKI